MDDVHDNRDLLRVLLQRKGIIVLEANDGREAIQVACLQHLDGILMDLSMPIMDGFEATRQLKGLDATKEIPIVAVSAYCSDSELCSKAVEAGCLYCINKPFELAALDSFLQAI